MRQTVIVGITTLLVLTMYAPAYATYSVVGVNTRTGEVGIAGAS